MGDSDEGEMGVPDHGEQPVAGRRPLKSRSTGWARIVTRALLKSQITPNHISLLGILFATLGVVAMLAARGVGTVGANVPQSRWWWLAAALCVQLRLLANMFDGLVAVEGARAHPTGALYNELPDRVQDFLLLFGAGLSIGYPVHGLIVVLLATLCAYVRVVGGAIGLPKTIPAPWQSRTAWRR